jgi:hypothetical protein
MVNRSARQASVAIDAPNLDAILRSHANPNDRLRLVTNPTTTAAGVMMSTGGLGAAPP